MVDVGGQGECCGLKKKKYTVPRGDMLPGKKGGVGVQKIAIA